MALLLPTKKNTLLLCALCIVFISNAQNVGLVLSGGGATGMVHIGVLKALEENNIPIDYITGTSMGALIGAMYAAGYSPNQIDSMFRTEQFQIMAEGNIEPQFEHYFQKEDKDASLISLKFFTDTAITTSLPTNFRDPTLLDLELMLGFAGAQTVSKGNMDSLFVPFRCVAADLELKGPVTFRDGDLAQAVRASMSYPFYFKTIKINGHIMFDGGLYNNFPADVMQEEFQPDIIIGSNVSYNDPPPSEDDIISQMKAMVMQDTDYSINTENGIIIEPETNVGRFDFDLSEQAMNDGYNSTMLLMDSIKAAVSRRETQQKVGLKRKLFNDKKPALKFGKVVVNNLNRSQNAYMDRILDPKKGKKLERFQLKKKYFRAYSDKNIKELYPTATYDPTLKSYRLDVMAKREKDMEVQFGGVFSSKPINTGFVGLKYRLFERASSIIAVNSYFGKFYGSLQGRIRIDLSTGIPIYIEPQITQNRWDYFKSFSTFFEEVRPSFIVQRELHGGINNGYSLGSKGELRFDIKYAQLRDEYYQTDDFSNTDTVDVTTFYNGNIGVMLERNSLDRKEYASAGEWISLSVRYVKGTERNIPGSTSEHKDEFNADHAWLQLKLVVDKYFNRQSAFKFGFHLSSVYSDQPFFNNYTATIIRAPSFEPIPEARTRVMPEFRAHQYVAGGLRSIIRIKKSFDIRIEGFIFQPFEAIKKNAENKSEYGKPFSDQYYIASGTAVWHSPLGPVAFSANYLDQQTDPWSLIFSFGYILFNQKAME